MTFNDTKKIKETKEKFNCPYCRDLGMIFLETEEVVHNGRPVVNDASRPCICTLNGMVSKKYHHLNGIPYIKGEDCISIGKKIIFNNYKFFGDESRFLHIVKAFIILHYHYNKTFTVLTGANIAEKYVMQQPDGFVPTVTPLTDFDLVVLLCTSTINNKGIAPSCYEMVNNRARARKPTWIYAETDGKLVSSRENTHEGFESQVVTLLEDYRPINIDIRFKDLKFDLEAKKKTEENKARYTQQSAGSV